MHRESSTRCVKRVKVVSLGQHSICMFGIDFIFGQSDICPKITAVPIKPLLQYFAGGAARTGSLPQWREREPSICETISSG